MLNKKLLIVILSAALATTLGCGQKGPLYESEPAPENTVQQDAEQAEPSKPAQQ